MSDWSPSKHVKKHFPNLELAEPPVDPDFMTFVLNWSERIDEPDANLLIDDMPVKEWLATVPLDVLQ